ncbi:MAG: sigma-70 family RNA polymerase sigma factor [Cytophagales bacterium]|nr:sigma-70 family RNA polymerase sigma factor [Cytophagales bacterium]
MNHAQTIALYQPTLQRIAYNLVRCKADAEDIVQETFLKWLSVESAKIRNTKAYLIKAVTNNCLNHLHALKKKKVEYLDSINVAEFLHRFKENNLAHLDLEADLDKALKVIHAKLEPLERAVYLLKEVFDFDYEAIQQALDKKKAHCRQLVCRARKKLGEETSKMHFDLPDVSGFMASFRKSCEMGNAVELIQELKKDITTAIEKKF